MPRQHLALALLGLLAAAAFVHADLDFDDDNDFIDDGHVNKAGLKSCDLSYLTSSQSNKDLASCYRSMSGTACPQQCKTVYDKIGAACIDELIKSNWRDMDDDDVDELGLVTSLAKNCATA